MTQKQRMTEEDKGFQGTADDLYSKPKVKSLSEKLFDLQSEVGAIAKDSKNPFFKSKYFDINALIGHIQPLLKKHRLLLTQPIENAEVRSIIECVDGGGSRTSSMRLPDITDPQKIGGAISYYRRYTLVSLCALQSEDDDANVASQASKGKDEKPWLNATNKDGSLTKNGEYTAQRLYNEETTWEVVLQSVKVSKKDTDAVNARVNDLLSQE